MENINKYFYWLDSTHVYTLCWWILCLQLFLKKKYNCARVVIFTTKIVWAITYESKLFLLLAASSSCCCCCFFFLFPFCSLVCLFQIGLLLIVETFCSHEKGVQAKAGSQVKSVYWIIHNLWKSPRMKKERILLISLNSKLYVIFYFVLYPQYVVCPKRSRNIQFLFLFT